MILIRLTMILAVTLPLAAEWSYLKHEIQGSTPGKRVAVITITNGDGKPDVIKIQDSQWGTCSTTAEQKVEACLADKIARRIAYLNDLDTRFAEMPEGPITPALAISPPEQTNDPDRASLMLFADKLRQLQGCVEAVRLGLFSSDTCEPLRKPLQQQWEALTTAKKLYYLEFIR